MHTEYSDKLLDHFRNPRNVGTLDKACPCVGTAVVGSADCGDVVKLQIRVDADGRIVDARFKTFGCGPAIAASSLTTEWLKGRTVEQAGELRDAYIAEELSLPAGKVHCSAMAGDAVKAAIADWQSKARLRAARRAGDAAAGPAATP
ncbi:MAG TPA: iron-sulfur cluster assembly scaffold protein [Phycisphaerae bacterium]|nr:iron-sulfur cluster assembly scaffold protein [Phycisphaerae bacterium]